MPTLSAKQIVKMSIESFFFIIFSVSLTIALKEYIHAVSPPSPVSTPTPTSTSISTPTSALISTPRTGS